MEFGFIEMLRKRVMRLLCISCRKDVKKFFSTYIRKGVTYHVRTGHPVDCLFCRIQRKESPGKLVYEDEHFVAFPPLSIKQPHLLIIPREHIRDISMLSGPEDVKIVKEMVQVGHEALLQYAGGSSSNASFRFLFHRPPWYSYI